MLLKVCLEINSKAGLTLKTYPGLPPNCDAPISTSVCTELLVSLKENSHKCKVLSSKMLTRRPCKSITCFIITTSDIIDRRVISWLIKDTIRVL